MLWRSLNFWRIATFCLFAAVLALSYPLLNPGAKFQLQDSSMQIVNDGSRYGALFKYTVRNDGSDGGEAHVNFHAYLYDRGGDSDDDYTTIGVNAGGTKSGEFFMPLVPGQTVHDWRVEIT